MAIEDWSPPRPGPPSPPGRSESGTAAAIALSSIGIIAGCVALGFAGGAAWSAISPRVAFAAAGPGQANLVDPETTGFIVADLAYCLVAAAGGLIAGLAGYLAGVRRHGPIPMLALLAGASGAAYAQRWLGQWFGHDQFRHLLATSKPGTILSAPLVLGAQGGNAQALWAMCFWPMFACLVAGGLTLRALLRDRKAAAAAAQQWPAGPGSPYGQPPGPAYGPPQGPPYSPPQGPPYGPPQGPSQPGG